MSENLPEKGAFNESSYMVHEFTPREAGGVVDFYVTPAGGEKVHYYVDMMDGELLIYTDKSDHCTILGWPERSDDGGITVSQLHLSDDSGGEVQLRWETAKGNHTLTIITNDNLNEKTEVIPPFEAPEKLGLPRERFPIYTEAAAELISKKEPEIGDDFIVVDYEKAVFGVFDGVGSAIHGGDAAHLGMNTLHHYAQLVNRLHSPDRPPAEQLAAVLRHAHKVIFDHYNHNAVYAGSEQASTTATVAQLDYTEDGRALCSWASVGDSRLYRFSRTGALECITEDDGFGNGITNYLGRVDMELEAHNSGQFFCEPGDLVLIMSDGISDQIDWEPAAEAFFKRSLHKRPEYYHNADNVRELASMIAHSFAAAKSPDGLTTFRPKYDDRSLIIIPIPD